MMPESRAPHLIVSDIDGTLIDSQERVPRQVCDALTHAHQAGTRLILATGRPARWLEPIIEQLDVMPDLCVCANGAVVFDPTTDEIVSKQELSPDVLRSVVRYARETLDDVGGVGVGVERAGTHSRENLEQQFVVSPEFVHSWDSTEHTLEEEAVLLRKPAVKLLLRNDKLTSTAMHERVAAVVPGELAHVTYSMEGGLLEVMVPGVNKSVAVARIAQQWGIDSADFLAFGDMPNDIELLQWAGRGIAVGNAHERVKEAADAVTATNNEGGIATVLHQWF